MSWVTTLPESLEAYCCQGQPGEIPQSSACRVPSNPSSYEICPVRSAVHVPIHTYINNPRHLKPSGTNSSTCIPQGLLSPGTTSSLKPLGTTSSAYIPGILLPPGTTNSTLSTRSLLPSGTTSSTCNPRGLLPSRTTRPSQDKQMAKGQHKNTINENQATWHYQSYYSKPWIS